MNSGTLPSDADKKTERALAILRTASQNSGLGTREAMKLALEEVRALREEQARDG